VVAPDIVGAERRLNEIGPGKRAAAPTRSRVTKMADQAPEFDGRARADLPPGIFGMMAVPVTATVIAILYFAREVFVPITLAVLLSFLLAPAVRWLRRLRVGRITQSPLQ
jgi:hypothetical protein